MPPLKGTHKGRQNDRVDPRMSRRDLVLCVCKVQVYIFIMLFKLDRIKQFKDTLVNRIYREIQMGMNVVWTSFIKRNLGLKMRQ